ncbi:MAG: glycosyltransferase family 4 protein [Rubripirellula sp.]
MKAVFLTAGAAGMYCGSCMHDNALALAMRDQDVDCVLQPVYTPIRTDVESIASEQVFFGGIHIYLLQQLPWIRFVPGPLRRLLDWTPLIRMATSRVSSTDATKLGELTLSMLAGSNGRQRDEVNRLVDWLEDDMKPDAILLSNLLIGGALPTIRQRLPKTKLAVLLQGDDIFLDFLPDHQREEALRLCRELVSSVDHFIVHSQFYADKMAAMLQIPADKIKVTPLSIDVKPFSKAVPDSHSTNDSTDRFRLGFLARISPEKGLHLLVDSFLRLAEDEQHADLDLHVAGWLGESNHGYLQQQRDRIEVAGMSHRFHYHGSPDLDAKIEFLRSLHLLCVPTEYEEPKGLFVLEALAAGVPVVQPNHGAFPELIERTAGGALVPPGDHEALADSIAAMKSDPVLRKRHAQDGMARVHAEHSIETAARLMKSILFGPSH